MLGFKIIGAVLLVISGWWLGIGLCAEEKRRVEQSRGAATLLGYIRSQIDIYLLPMADILRSCDAKLLRECGVDPTVAHPDNIVEGGGGLTDPDIRDTLKEYFRRAGRGDRAAELALCDSCIRTLETRHQKLSGEYSRRCRMIMTLCICAPACAALLLF